MKQKSKMRVSDGIKTKAQLEQELIQANKLIAAQEITIQKLHDKLTSLESNSGSVPTIGTSQDLDEVTIAQIQLKRLGEIALVRQLTTEEARLFEIFSKTIQQDKRLDQGNKGSSRPFRDVTPQKLLNIANLALPDNNDD